MLAAEHLSIVQALNYGSLRNDATLAAAVAAIGSQPRRLVLTFDGDGLWTFTSAWGIPTNITLEIPPGVFVSGAGHGSVLGPVLSWSAGWYVGAGGVSYSNPSVFFSAISTNAIGMGVQPPVANIHIKGPTTSFDPVGIRLEEGQANAGALLSFVGAGGPVLRAQLGLIGTQDVGLSLTSLSRFIVTGGNVGIGTAPSHQLQLSTDDAWKPGTTTWSVVSDARTKEEDGAFTDGLSVVLAVRPVRYHYNGKGGTPTDNTPQIGVLAQELEPVAPYMVSHTVGKLQESDAEETDLLGYQGHAMTFVLINAIKEQQALITDLQTRLAALETLAGDRAEALEAIAHTHTGAGTAKSDVEYVPAAQQAHHATSARKRK